MSKDFVYVSPSVFCVPEKDRKYIFDVAVPRREDYSSDIGNADVIVHYFCGCSKLYVIKLDEILFQSNICELCGQEFFIDLSAYSRSFSE